MGTCGQRKLLGGEGAHDFNKIFPLEPSALEHVKGTFEHAVGC